MSPTSPPSPLARAMTMSWSATCPVPLALARLDAGMACRLVLIVAPPGSGKTRLLRQWAEHRSALNLTAPAWVSLEMGDNDVANFLQHLRQAFRELDPQLVNPIKPLIVEKTAPATRSKKNPWIPGGVNPEDVLIDLINALAGQSREIPLILDEYHVIDSPEVYQAVSFLINYLPENVHLYLATRDEPHLRVANLRARREMIELGPADLSTSLE